MNNIKQLFLLDLPINDLLRKISKYDAHFFADSIDGIVIMANDLQANYFGENSVSSFLGQSVFEFMHKAEAKTIISNNFETINNNRPQLLYETCLNKKCLSIKAPLRDSSNHIIGIGGIACYFHQVPFKDIISLINKMIYVNPTTNALKYNSHLTNKLSKREQECAHYLTKSMTYKEIASTLSISPRTVEKHIENIKNKLGCNSLSDIVSMIFESK